ncbi:MAG TPA: hypothetical protein VF229_07665 [Burkholderiaceae bacterium]
MSRSRILAAGLVAIATGAASACSDGGGREHAIAPQRWGEIEIKVETRPAPPRPGANEILVMATGPHGRPVHDLMILVRAGDQAPWTQAIQDGYVGVYRRALQLGPENSMLQVQARSGGEQKVFSFALAIGDRQ